MATLTPEQVAGAAASAGFSGDALVTIVAIAKRESGYNPEAQGDIGIQDATWGPSVGLFQIRTLKAQTGSGGDRDLAALIPGAVAGQPGTGQGDVARQARAAFNISSGGTNFKPWSTYKGLSQGDLDEARRAVAGKTNAPTLGGNTPLAGVATGGIVGGLVDVTTGAIADVLGIDDLIAEVFVVVVAGIFVIAAFALMVVGTERVSGARLRPRASELRDAGAIAGLAAAAA